MAVLNEFDRQVKEKIEGYEYDDLPEGMMVRIHNVRTPTHKFFNYFRLKWKRSLYALLLLFMSSTTVICLAYFFIVPFQEEDTVITMAQNSGSNLDINSQQNENTDGEVFLVSGNSIPTYEVISDESNGQTAQETSAVSENKKNNQNNKNNRKYNNTASSFNKTSKNKNVRNSDSRNVHKTNTGEANELSKIQPKDDLHLSYMITDTISVIQPEYADEPLIKNKKADRWRFDVYAGPALVSKSIVVKDEFDQYKKLRDRAESFPVAFSAGANINYTFNNNWSIQTGVAYTHVKEKIGLTTSEDVVTMKIDTTIIYIQAPNEPPKIVYEYDTTMVNSLLYHYQSANSYYTLVDVPVVLNYHLQKGRWSYGIGSGVIWNFIFSSKGSYINDSLKVTSYEKDKGPYKTSLRLGLVGRAEVRYHMNERWSVYAEPVYRYYFSPVGKTSYPAKEHLSMLSVHSGVSFRF